MKHSGLQKSISSIFDGAEPVKQDSAAAIAAAPAQMPLAAAPKVTFPVAVSTSPLAAATVQAPPAVAQAAAPQAAKPLTRPRPVPKKNVASQKQNMISIKSLWTTIKSRLTGSSKGSLDSRQKKTVILVIGLAVVFVAVLMFVLGSGPSGAKAASKKAGKGDSPAAASKSGSVDTWQKPEIYPLSLRDPMKPSSGVKNSDQVDGEMIVRGIVFSSVNPSAIIANQIVYEGDVILGVKIVKIARDFVAFEKDGKQWQQQVRQ